MSVLEVKAHPVANSHSCCWKSSQIQLRLPFFNFSLKNQAMSRSFFRFGERAKWEAMDAFLMMPEQGSF